MRTFIRYLRARLADHALLILIICLIFVLYSIAATAYLVGGSEADVVSKVENEAALNTLKQELNECYGDKYARLLHHFNDNNTGTADGEKTNN